MVDYLRERAERGSRQKFKAALAKVPDVKAHEEDQLPGSVPREPSSAQSVERNFEIIGEALNRLRRTDPSTAGRIGDTPRIVAF
jgi:hypothetical protein